MDFQPFLIAIEQSAVGQFMNINAYAFPLVEVFHVVAIALVFGTILIVDLRLLGVASVSRPFTEIAAESLKWTWGGFVLAVVTGVLMFTVNPLFYFDNFEFRMKMLALLAAGINMLIFEFYVIKGVKTWDRTTPTPVGAKISGTLSLAFWLTVVIYGRLIGFAGSATDPFDMLF